MCTGWAPLSGQRRNSRAPPPRQTATAAPATRPRQSLTSRGAAHRHAPAGNQRQPGAPPPRPRHRGAVGAGSACRPCGRKGAAMGARLRALDAQPVRAAAGATAASVRTVTHTWLPAARSAAMTPSSGQPKVKLTTAWIGPQGSQLRVPVVVVPVRRSRPYTQRGGLRLKLGEVAGERRAVGGRVRRARHEHVDPERGAGAGPPSISDRMTAAGFGYRVARSPARPWRRPRSPGRVWRARRRSAPRPRAPGPAPRAVQPCPETAR